MQITKHQINSVKIIYAILLFALQQSAAQASPTSNEFEECNLRATKHLEYCLKDNINTTSNDCWSKSYTTYESCRKSVIARHDTSKQKQMQELEQAIEAMRSGE